MIPIEAVLDRPGRQPLRLTPVQNSLRWTTGAIGGFGSCGFQLPGDPARWKRELGYLGILRLVYDTQIAWEGQIEDIGLVLTGEGVGAQVQAFGLQRLLDEEGVRRIWTKRDWTYQRRSAATIVWDGAFDEAQGAFNEADLTMVGVQFAGNGGTSSSVKSCQLLALAPAGLTLNRLLCTKQKGGNASLVAQVQSSADGASYTIHHNSATNETVALDLALVANARDVMLFAGVSGGFVTAITDLVRFYDIRVLGTSLTEDASGGFYGGTILRDLLALVDGLTIGDIESGSDFTIQSIERAVRSSIRSVVEEVAAYYSRYWAVWEDGRFDWKTHSLDEPNWIVPLSECGPGTELQTTVDGLARTVYVLYTDAADGREKEASAVSTAQRNPYVKQSKTKDELVPVGFPMTSATSAQLASRLKDEIGKYPRVEGRIVFPAEKVLRRHAGSPLPGWMVRGGDTLLIPDLPKTDLFETGRDGETLFHIISTEADLEQGTVTLEVEGQTRSMDVLLARLAAVTRFPTGVSLPTP